MQRYTVLLNAASPPDGYHGYIYNYKPSVYGHHQLAAPLCLMYEAWHKHADTIELPKVRHIVVALICVWPSAGRGSIFKLTH